MIDRATRTTTAAGIRPGDIVEIPGSGSLVPLTVERVALTRDGVIVSGHRPGWKSTAKADLDADEEVTVLADDDTLAALERLLLEGSVGHDTHGRALVVTWEQREWMIPLRAQPKKAATPAE